MPSSNEFLVEYAKSNMATCRVCMAKIPKESLRVGHQQVPLDDGTPKEEPKDARASIMAAATKWYHFECFPKMKGAKWMAANLPNDLLAVSGYTAIKQPDQKRVYKMWKALQSDSGAGGSAGGKRKADGSEPEGKASKLAKLTSVQGVLSASDFKRISALEAELAPRTSAQLQAELGENNQIRGGKKDELAKRVAEGRVLGSLPPCPKCEKGQLHWSRVGGWFSCPGFYDKELTQQRRCYFRSQEVKRGKWIAPKGAAKGSAKEAKGSAKEAKGSAKEAKGSAKEAKGSAKTTKAAKGSAKAAKMAKGSAKKSKGPAKKATRATKATKAKKAKK